MFYLIFFLYFNICSKLTYSKYKTFEIKFEIKSKGKTKKIKGVNKINKSVWMQDQKMCIDLI